MNLLLNAEQAQFQDGARRILQDIYSFPLRQRYAASSRRWSEEAWSMYADSGMLGIAVPADSGGLEGKAEDLLPIMQELGRALALEPYLSTAVLGAVALAGVQASEERSTLLRAVAKGECRLAFAYEDPAVGGGLQANLDGGSWKISGRKCMVLHARDANRILATASVSSRQGIGLFLVEPDAPGVVMEDYLLVDQRTASNVAFHGAPAMMIGQPGNETSLAVDRAIDFGIAALVAEAAGATRAALDSTRQYMGLRKQFGKTLSEFQVLRHRAADMLVSVETIEAMACLSAIAADHPHAPESRRDLAGAKLLAAQHGRWVCEEAIQVHGAMGMTDEYLVGHYLQRLLTIDCLLGNADVQLDALTRG